MFLSVIENGLSASFDIKINFVALLVWDIEFCQNLTFCSLEVEIAISILGATY